MEVRPVSVERILDLRGRVLRPGLTRDAARFDGDLGQRTVHLAAMDADGQVIGCVTLLREVFQRAPWRLRGMAVDESHRGEGVGTALLQAAHQAAAPEAIWCNARLTAAPFYTRHGWQTISDVFAISHVGPHVRMLHGGR